MKFLVMCLLAGTAFGAEFQAKLVAISTRSGSHSNVYSRAGCAAPANAAMAGYCNAAGATYTAPTFTSDTLLTLQTPDREFVVNCYRLRKHLPELGTMLTADNAKKRKLTVAVDGKKYECPITEERLLGNANDPLGIR